MNARLLSFEILLEFEKSKRWLRNVRNDYFDIKRPPRSACERTTVLTNEVVKWQRLLDTIINANLHKPSVKLKFPVRNLLRLGVYELLMDEISPDYAVVDSYVKLSRKKIGPHITGLINAILRKISGSGKYVFNGKFPENIAVGLSYPDWLVEKWGTYYGMDDTVRLCEYFNCPGQMMVRRNRLKIEHDALVQKLLDDKIHVKRFPRSKHYYIVEKGAGLLLKHQFFQKGIISVQDRAAGAVVELLNPQPGETVLDVCAAPGTKTFYIAEIMQGAGSLIATDISGRRMKLCEKDSMRHSQTWINWKINDAAKDVFPKADRVLIDAPCSGTGTIGQKPEIRWRRKLNQLQEFKMQQLEILNNVSNYVKKGGMLCYATCSLEKEENWDVIKAFLKLNNRYKIDTSDHYLPKKWFKKPGVMETFPPRDKVIGMFAVRLKHMGK